MDGHFTEQLLRNLNYLQTSIVDPTERLSNYHNYIRDSVRFHKAIVLNGNLMNKHAESTMRYIDAGGDRILQGLQKLLEHVFVTDMLDDTSGRLATSPFIHNKQSYTYWMLQNPDDFVSCSWIYEELHKRFNTLFGVLTAVNLKTCNAITASSVAYRMGECNPNWTRMGMLNVVMNAMGKVQARQVPFPAWFLP